MCFNIFNVVTSFSGFIALCGLPLVAANGGCSLAEVPGLLTAVASLVGAHAPGHVVSVVWRALGHSPVVWHSGGLGSPQTREQTWSPALAGRFSPTAPPGESKMVAFMVHDSYLNEKSTHIHPLLIPRKIREEISSSKINYKVVRGNRLVGKLAGTHMTIGSSHMSDSGHTCYRNSET